MSHLRWFFRFVEVWGSISFTLGVVAWRGNRDKAAFVCPLKFGSMSSIVKQRVVKSFLFSSRRIWVGEWEAETEMGPKEVVKGKIVQDEKGKWSKEMTWMSNWSGRRENVIRPLSKKRSNITPSLAFLCSYMSPHYSSISYLLYLIEDCEGVEKFICHRKSEKGSYHSGRICAFLLCRKWQW